MAMYWNVKTLLEGTEIENGSRLAAWAGITPPVAYRVLDDKAPIERIETATLEALAKAFGMRSPWKLLSYKPDPVKSPVKKGSRR